MVFDIVLYTAAIVSVLAIIGSHKAPASAPRQIVQDLHTLHAIGEALPDEVFAVDTDSEFLTAEELLEEGCAVVVEFAGTFDAGDATAEESALVDAAEVAIALYWEARPTVNVVPFRRPSAHPALEGLGIRELKKLASAAKVRNYSVLTKAQLIQALRAA